MTPTATQLISRDISVTQKDGTVHNELNNTGEFAGLDVAYNYPGQFIETRNGAALTPASISPADGTTDLIYLDSPYYQWSISEQITKVHYLFHATDYAMYNPGTAGAIDVAIKQRSWGFYINVSSATATPGTYISTDVQQPYLTPWTDAAEPQWYSSIPNTATFVPPLN